MAFFGSHVLGRRGARRRTGSSPAKYAKTPRGKGDGACAVLPIEQAARGDPFAEDARPVGFAPQLQSLPQAVPST